MLSTIFVMIDPELNVKVVDKIKESNTEAKPQLTGLYFRLMELYVAEDKLKKGNLVLNGKRNTKISDYTEKVRHLLIVG